MVDDAGRDSKEQTSLQKLDCAIANAVKSDQESVSGNKIFINPGSEYGVFNTVEFMKFAKHLVEQLGNYIHTYSNASKLTGLSNKSQYHIIQESPYFGPWVSMLNLTSFSGSLFSALGSLDKEKTE